MACACTQPSTGSMTKKIANTLQCQTGRRPSLQCLRDLDPETGVEHHVATMKPFVVRQGQSGNLHVAFLPDAPASDMTLPETRPWKRGSTSRHQGLRQQTELVLLKPIILPKQRKIEGVQAGCRHGQVHLMLPSRDRHHFHRNMNIIYDLRPFGGQEEEEISSPYLTTTSAHRIDYGRLERVPTRDSREFHLPRNVNLTAVTREQRKKYIMTLFHAPTSPLENPS